MYVDTVYRTLHSMYVLYVSHLEFSRDDPHETRGVVLVSSCLDFLTETHLYSDLTQTSLRPHSDPTQTTLNPTQPHSLAQNYGTTIFTTDHRPPKSSVHYHRHGGGGTIAGPSSCSYIEECLSTPPSPLQSTILTTLVLHPTTPLPQQVTDKPQSCIMRWRKTT